MHLHGPYGEDDKNIRMNVREIKLWSRCGGAAEAMEIEVCQPSRKGDIEIDLHHVPVHRGAMLRWCYNHRN